MEILRKLCQICKITTCTGFACCSSDLLWLLLNFEWSSWKSNKMILSKRFCPNCVASIHHSTWAGGVLWRSTWCLRSLKAKPWGWGSTRLFYHFDEDFPIPPAHRCILTKTRPMKIPIDQSVFYGPHCDICGPWKQSREVGDQLASSITLTRTFPFHQHIGAFWTKSCQLRNLLSFLEKCVIFGEMCHFWINVLYMEECAIFGGMCHFWRNVTFLEECAIFGGMCHFWRNVL